MADVSDTIRRLRELAHDAMDVAMDEVAFQTELVAPVRTGALVSSIRRGQVSDSGSTFTADIAVTAPYADWMDKGTSEHDIIGNPLLVFYWPKVGRTVFFPRVHHPGTKALNFFTEPMPQRFHDALEVGFRSVA